MFAIVKVRASTMILFIIIAIVGAWSPPADTIQDPHFVRLRVPKSAEISFEEPIMRVNEDISISGFLPPNCSRTYEITVLEHSLLLLSLKIDTVWSRLEVRLKESPNKKTIERCYIPEISEGYIYYIVDQGEVNLTLSNIQKETVVKYRFFIDTSDLLQANNSKFVPLKSGLVAFHVDLKKDDRVSLNLNFPPNIQFAARVYVPSYRASLAVAGYMLRSYTESSNKTLSFTADLEGRYYVIIESVESAGRFSLVSKITSPYWNQWWFWPVVGISVIAAISSWLMNETKKLKDLEKTRFSIVIGNYCLLITLVLWSSSIGGYTYRSSALMLLFHSATLFLGLGLGFRVFADYLDRKKRTDVSDLWYLAPIPFSILSLLVCVFFLGFDFTEWWGTTGSIIGGLVAWVISKDAEKRKAWGFLAAGIVFPFIFPFLVYAFKSAIFRPFFIELYMPELGSYIFRVASPYQTLPQGFLLMFAILSIMIGFILINQIRKI